MIHNGKVYGKPLVQFIDTRANIEAMTGLQEGSIAYASDTNQLGSYNGSTWDWYSAGAIGQYRQLVWDVVGDDLEFLTEDGEAVYDLVDLE